MLVTSEDFLLFIYIYVFCFLGAFSKDMLDTFLDKISRVLIFKVLTSSFAVTILVYGLSEYLLSKISYRSFTTVCYILGIVSFEIMIKYSSAKEILEIIEDFKKWRINKKEKG